MSGEDGNIHVSPEELRQESRRLRDLGLALSDEPVFPARPYRRPLGAHSLLVPATWHWAEAPSEVDPRELGADLDLLGDVLEQAHPGWDGGPPWTEALEQWRSELTRAGARSLGIVRACAPWEALLESRLDNHSGPLTPHALPRLSRTVLLGEEPRGAATRWRDENDRVRELDADDPSHGPRLRKTWSPDRVGADEAWVIALPSGGPAPTALECGGRWMPLREPGPSPQSRHESIRQLSRTDRERLSFRMLADGIGYLRVPTLSLSLVDSLAAFAPRTVEAARTARAIVIDLRANRGGSAGPLRPFLSELLDAPALAGPLEIPMKLRRCTLTPALHWGYAQGELRGVKAPLAPELRMALQRQLDRLVAARQQEAETIAVRAATPVHDRRTFPGASPSGKVRTVVLTDGDCGSDGELLVYLLGTLPGAVIVGPNTAGVAGFAQPGRLVLPRTRIGFRVATATTDLHGDGRAIDGHGLETDLLPVGAAPIDEGALSRLLATVEALS